MVRFLKPKYFLLGILLGLATCSAAGYLVSQKARYNHFVRFFSYIGPALDYYPTASELLVTAKHDIDPKKTLVLIGGSSIFRGDGQNEDDVWTKKLQNLLGNDYQVLNYGFNAAQFPTFGGVAFRMLKEHFPKIIFVSTCSFAEEREIDGGKLYGYLFWDAYYKNLFRPDANEQQKIATLRRTQLKTADGIELHAMTYLDSLFYFRNLWNWINYRFIFTIWNDKVRFTPFQARRLYEDFKVDYKSLMEVVRNDKVRFENEAKSLIREDGYPKQVDYKTQHFTQAETKKMQGIYNNLFEPSQRGKILCFLPTYNPKHLATFPTKHYVAYQIIVRDTRSIIKSLGYHETQTPNLIPNDYVDMMHYLVSGGDKVAMHITPIIKNIAKENGYDTLKA